MTRHSYNIPDNATVLIFHFTHEAQVERERKGEREQRSHVATFRGAFEIINVNSSLDSRSRADHEFFKATAVSCGLLSSVYVKYSSSFVGKSSANAVLVSVVGKDVKILRPDFLTKFRFRRGARAFDENDIPR